MGPWERVCAAAALITLMCVTVNSQGCIEGEWKCASGNECIVQDYVCDGDPDCDDSSDEDLIMCAKWTCVSLSVNCVSNRKNNTLPFCVNTEAHCDGMTDCLNGEDELNCPNRETECPPGEFVCGDGTCIPAALHCDTQRDCTGGEDEESCSDYPNYMPCKTDQFRCQSGQCVAAIMKCDYRSDCRDNSDEDPGLCRLQKVGCDAGYFLCEQGATCIPLDFVCNQRNDCADGADEDKAMCGSLGVNECANSTINKCQHNCTNLLVGYTCTCQLGYKVGVDKSTCQDINECVETPGICSQYCKNTLGGHICSCNSYYTLDSKTGKCKAKSKTPSPFLIFGNKYYVRRVGLEPFSYSHLSAHHQYTHVLDYLYSTQEIFYADSTPSKQTIKKMMFNGTELGVIERNHAYGIEGIAVDWVAKKLYWTNSHVRGILVSELDGASVKTLTQDNSDQPRALALCPEKGYIFWTDWGGVPFIGRIGMDGSRWRKVIENGLFWPNGITADYVTKRIWWADAHLDRIEFANFDGSGRNIAVTGLAHPYALSIFEERMYWTDWNLKRVESANKFTGADRKVIVSSVHLPHDIHVVHPLRQPKSRNPCGNNNGGCSHLCLIAGGGGKFTCACPDNYIFQADQKTCTINCTAGHYKCGAPEPKCVPTGFVCDGKQDCAGGQDENLPYHNCTNISKCQPGWFRCPGGGCVPYWNVCDRRAHCRDKSDETKAMCSIRECMPYEFRCSSGQCLPRAWQCDGDKDCSDGTDEKPLNKQCDVCKHTDFKCNNGKCIPKTWYCDWDDDCGDMSDEPRGICYANKTCDPGWERCKHTYRCVAHNYWCNGNNDCRDNSDEDPVRCKTCQLGEFTCKKGMPKCIPQRWVCDFNSDCGDRSDEETTMCKNKYRKCSESEFRCQNNRCIRKTKRCDGSADCSDRSDELGCATDNTCANGTFRCMSGQCIPANLRCDGHIDCRQDAADETPDCKGQPTCSAQQFRCNNGACVTRAYVCDGDNDCMDSSDETEAACKSIPCDRANQFRCKTTLRCIPRYLVCNRRQDCGSGDTSDESNSSCTPKEMTECKPNEYRCLDGTCLPAKAACNFKYECNDRSDEIGCVKSGNCSVNRGGCQGNCTDLQNGYIKCFCEPGLTPRGSSCSDIDECKNFAMETCSQTCTNIKKSYTCSCKLGFETVHLDKGACQLDNKTTESPLLLYTMGSSIEGFFYRKNHHVTIALGQRDPVGLAVDPINQIVFWSDRSLKKIFRSAIPRKVEELGIPEVISPAPKDKDVTREVSDIAYDWMGRNLYWAEGPKKKIFVSKDDGRYPITLVVTSHYVQPTSLAVNSELGMLYWVEQGSGPTTAILSQSMSGDGRAVPIVRVNLWQPASLTIDYHKGGRLFWVDRVMQTIESVNPDGRNRYSYHANNLPYSVAVFSDSMFYTVSKKGIINLVNKFGKGTISKVYNNPTNSINNIIMDHLRIYNTSLPNRCTDLHCSHLCLIKPGGAVCKCPDNIPLSNASYCHIAIEKPRPDPSICTCQNGGYCILVGTNSVCACRPGYSGSKCELKGGGGPSPITQTWPEPTTFLVTIPPSYRSNSLLAAILAPVLIALLILGAVSLVLFYLYRTGRIGRKKSGQGEFREGTSGHDANQNSAGGAEFTGPYIESPITFTEGGVHFSNPIYDTIDKNRANGNNQSVPLETKPDADA